MSGPPRSRDPNPGDIKHPGDPKQSAEPKEELEKPPRSVRPQGRPATGQRLAETLRKALEEPETPEAPKPAASPPQPSPMAADLPDEDFGDEVVAEELIDAPDKIYFRIGEVAQLVGVDAHVLRYWESEFSMKPRRSPSGQRLYKKTDLSRFLRIKALLHDEGYTIAGARKVLTGGTTSPSVDPARVKVAIDRVKALRRMIRGLQDDLEEEQV